MARFLFAILLIAASLVQSTLLPAVQLLGLLPDIALVLLLVWSATHGIFEGVFWAFGLGLWIDLLTMDRLGTHGIALIVVAVIGGATRGRLFRSGAVLPIVAVLAATMAFNLVSLLLGTLSGDAVDVAGTLRLALMTSLLNALLVPLAYGVLFVFDRWIPHHV